MSEHEKRLIGMEERLMHQERLLEDLNEVVTAQADTLERLAREITRLREQLAKGSTPDVDEPPPHY